MLSPPIPPFEAARLDALRELAVLDTATDEALDEITAFLARQLDVPIALVSLVDEHRQWFKSRHGLDATETPRDISFCGHVVAADEPLVVNDAAIDARFFDNPLVTDAPNIRFYAACPIRTFEGQPIGTLCAIGVAPRALSADELALLKLLARQVGTHLVASRGRSRLAERTQKLEIYQEFFLRNLGLQCTANASFHFEELNPAWTEVLGYPLDELRARPFLDFVHPDDLESTVAEASRLVRDSSTTVNFENRYRARDGHYVNLSWVASVKNGTFFSGAHDVTAYRTQQRALEASSERLAAILDTAPDAIVTVTDSGVVLHANRGAEALFGEGSGDIRGRRLEQMLDLPGSWPISLEAARDDDAPRLVVHQARARRSDATSVPVELSTGRFVAEGRTVFTCVIRDVSERERLAQLQAEFISTVSHELRTPLTAIRGALGLVGGGLMGELPDEANEYVNIALVNCDRLVRLLNDILDIEKTEAGKWEFRYEVVGLAAVAQAAIVANAATAEAARVSLVVNPGASPGDALVDPGRLMQVLTNLISNAVKFSPERGCVELAVERHGHWLRVTVRDHGPGVPEAFRERIFRRFAQADGSDTRARGGTGLGLSIARSIGEAMGGRLGFENAADGGAAFWLDLPYIAPVGTLSAIPTTGGGLALVCEDDPDVVRLITTILEDLELQVHSAPTLARARELLHRFDYTLITLDLRLADGDGAELVAELQASLRHRNTPVVVVTGEVPAPTAASLRVSDVVGKPFDVGALGQLMAEALSSLQRLPPRILHVEDDPDTRRVVARVLPATWHIRGVPNLAEACRALAEATFDIVLLDHSLPDGTGDQLLGAVGKAQVVVFSAADSPGGVYAPAFAALVKSRDSLGRLREVLHAAMQAR